GAGLGDEFLKHIERTRVLLHLVDLSDEASSPVERFQIIQKEMEMYQKNLIEKPMIVVGTKIDINYDTKKEDELRNIAEEMGFPYFKISAATHKGLKPLVKAIWSFFEEE
ncbi:MAG: GTPase ObgE, partial [Acidobacteriota bacterium]